MEDRRQKPTNESQEQSSLSVEFSETMKRELVLTAACFQASIDELLCLAYLEALRDLSPPLIHLGFKKARRSLAFFPKPVEVRELAFEEFEAEKRKEPRALPEPELVWTDEDRRQWREDIARACGVKPPPLPLSQEQINERAQTLRAQRDELLSKIPNPKKPEETKQ